MFYRVDYSFAVLLIGAVAALLASGRAERVAPGRLARRYLVAVGALAAIRVAGFLAINAAGVAGLPTRLLAGIGDLGLVVLGSLYGLAIAGWRTGRGAAVLREPELRLALCLMTAASFATSGIAKAFELDAMTEFFAASGYTRSFLYVVIAGEVVGAVALLLPWRATVVATVAAFAIDMFGAIATHAHNGDPLDDSTGAIVMLLRLALIARLCLPWRGLGLGAAACAVIAFAGGAAQRHVVIAAPTPAPADELDYLVGSWQCDGRFARSGAAIAADLRAEKTRDGRWLVVHYDDHPPASYHALAEWSHGPAGWLATIQDATGGARTFQAAGWQHDELIWTGGDPGGTVDQRFRYHRLAPDRLSITFERLTGAAWQAVDTVTCSRKAAA